MRIADIKAWADKHDLLAAVIIGVIGLFITLLLIIILPDMGPVRIHDHLADMGFDVQDIVFEKAEDNDFWDGVSIYEASEAIEYFPGVFVDKWKYRTYTGSTYSSINWSVSPYPELPDPVEINLRMSVSPSDYEKLAELAGERTVEDYLKDVVKKTIRKDE